MLGKVAQVSLSESICAKGVLEVIHLSDSGPRYLLRSDRDRRILALFAAGLRTVNRTGGHGLITKSVRIEEPLHGKAGCDEQLLVFNAGSRRRNRQKQFVVKW